MVNGLFIWILKSKIVLILLLSLFFGRCLNNGSKEIEQKKLTRYQHLKSGDVVLRLGNGYFSSIFKNYASREQKYSHIGIVSIEDNIAFVYHAEASEFTGVGSVKKETLNYFLKDIEVFDFYRLEKYDAVHIAKVAKDYFNAKTPFDLDFNTKDDSELYCAELVANAININLSESFIKPTILLGNKTLYGLDDIYLKMSKLSK